MHPSALNYGKLFFNCYCKELKNSVVVDIGSQNVNGSLKDVCPPHLQYTGVDFVSGDGVDIVLNDPYKLPFESESIDVVVCSSCFEHSDLFWLTFLEILRVLKPSGLFYLNVPSNGYIHRFPIDSWRFYPDAGKSLVIWARRNGYSPVLLESFVGAQQPDKGDEGKWNDFVAVFGKDQTKCQVPKKLIMDSVDDFSNGWKRESKSLIKPAYKNQDFLLRDKLETFSSTLEQTSRVQRENLDDLRKTVIALEDRIASQSEHLKNRDTHIAELSAEISRRGEQLSTIGKQIQEKSESIIQLEKTASRQKYRIKELKKNIAEGDTELAALRAVVVDRDHNIVQRDSMLAAMRNSWSWKITAPLRFASYLIRNLIRIPLRLLRITIVLFPYLLRAVRHPLWGIKMCRKAWHVLNTQGIAGIRIRLAEKKRQKQAVADYQKWIGQYDTLDGKQRKKILRRIDSMENKLKISIIMPVYNPPLQFLDNAIQSVRKQLYSHWELCIADDASTKPAVRKVLERHAKADKRIKVVYREENGHISRASNSALELATGDFVALMDHDDELAEHALFWVADAINENPDAQLIYSDEDKLDESGLRYDPYFKCEFNYELLLGQNMISHLGIYKRSLLEDIGGFRVGLEGSQDYDLVLRALENIETSHVVHIPRILYHWRAISGSTALHIDEKNYAVDAARRAISEHLERMQIDAEVLPHPENDVFSRVRFGLPKKRPLVSIIIPTKDRAELLAMCIDSIIEKTTYDPYEIIIVDNGSTEDETKELFERLPRDKVQIIRDESPFNFSALNNKGAKRAHGELICLMNNDIEILTPDWLEEMVSIALRPEIGCVGARLWYPDGRLQHGGVILGIGGVAGHAHKYFYRGLHGYFSRMQLSQSLSAVTAACLTIRRSVFKEVGGLDESLAIAFNDIDFCLRVRDKGYRNVWTPYAEMNHHESASRGHEDTPEKINRFKKEVTLMKKRWKDQLLNDPAYSPNLTLEHENFSLAYPPRVSAL